MGLCGSTENMSVDEKVEKRQSKNLDQQLADDHDRQDNVNRLLLLGAGESGKTTLLRQMTCIYGEGFNDDDKKGYVNIIYGNIMDSIKNLCQNSSRYGKVSDENAQYLTLMHEADGDVAIDLNIAQAIKSLWADPCIQETYNNRNSFQLFDSTAYYFGRIDAIAEDGFIPTLDDILRSRVATSGIVEQEYNIDGNTFIMLDVGGQRSERKKWINCFTEVTAVIFVASMSAYDQVLFEDDQTNRMREAIKVFKDVLFQQWFEKTSIIFFFNKKDLFAEKIQTKSVKDCFPREHELYVQLFPELAAIEDNYEREGKFVQKLFLDQNLFLDPDNPMVEEEVQHLQQYINDKEIYTHETCATDTDHIKVVFGIVKDIVIKRGLQRAGLM